MTYFLGQQQNKGFTLLEIVVAVGISALLMGAIVELFLTSYRSKDLVIDQFSIQADGRRAVNEFIATVRRATYSEAGAYPIELAADQEFIFFTNDDSDALRERVRYFIVNTTLKKGVIKPTGQPSAYPANTEIITDLAHSLTNGAAPVFYYYDASYTGAANNFLATPADVAQIRLVGISLSFDKKSVTSAQPFVIESKTQLRNLKNN